MWNLVGAFTLGACMGGFVMFSAEVIKANDVYREGRQSVLERKIVVGGDPASPCAVEIPLGALVDMVNSGVMIWHERCVEMIEAERGKP